jgi:PKHD-type hydroxylase
MRGEWCYFSSYFSKKNCEDILKMGLTLPSSGAKIGVDGEVKTNDTRKSIIRFIEKKDKRFEQLFDTMWKLAIQSNDEWFDFHISKIDYIQLAEYDASYEGKYNKHHDVFWSNNDPKYHRKLSAIVQLTDPSEYDGGDFEFFGLNEYPKKEEIRKQGTVTFFPSFLEHQATPVTRGKRYSLACWFDGPKWR